MYKRYPAQPARRKPKPTTGFKIPSLALLLVLLVLPGLALHRLSSTDLDWRVAAGYLAVLSVATSLLYRTDKLRAQTGGWRTPEATLHLLELAGGWPAAFVAQRTFRHKISKPAYQLTFWLIVAIYQCAAGDFLLEWRISEMLLQLVKRGP